MGRITFSAPPVSVAAITESVEAATMPPWTRVPIPLGAVLYAGAVAGPPGVGPHFFGTAALQGNVTGSAAVTSEPAGALSPAHALGIAAIRTRVTTPTGGAANASITTLQSTASGAPRIAALLSRFVAGTAGGGITARGLRVATSVLRQVIAAAPHTCWLGAVQAAGTAAGVVYFGFVCDNAAPNWRAVVTVAGLGAPLIDVDLAAPANTSQTLDLRIQQRTDTVPYAQWIIGGTVRHEHVGLIPGFTPLTASIAAPLDWAIGVGLNRPANAAEVDLYAAVNDTFEIQWI